MIFIDWGTTHARAWCGDERRDGPGMRAVKNWPATFRELTRGWQGEALICGMAGARGGWVEVPYVDCPTGVPTPREVVPGVRIVPGLRCQHDVMRGEETQLFGAGADGLYCLPGTHTKWARMKGGQIMSFRTVVTGELFDAVVKHTLMGALMDGDSGQGFDAGLDAADAPGGLQHHIFQVRSRVLDGSLSAADARSWLSGLLIGHELNDLDMLMGLLDAPVTVIGSPALCDKYVRAMTTRGIPTHTLRGPEATLAGLRRMA